jgi:NAD(P)-dependent dehydrogenase (short-subunit alcohol dehydrogenase family)
MSFAVYPSLKEAVVFITGGASGIGAEIVRAFVAQGSRVGFIDIDTERGQTLAGEFERHGTAIRFEGCDLRDIDALKRTFAALEAALGPATVLVNNAARDDRMTGRRRRLTTMTSGSQPTCVTCSLRFKRWPRA